MSKDKGTTDKKMRPPIVVVLGHVDHGKTTLLDTIRQTSVASKESGGITQHIGAYQAEVKGRKMTFLDTPGHEAFTAIRSRGAKVADVAILVVAADEGVKPQTKEAIKIIKESGIPFIVAINKTDKEGANIQKVKQDLATEEVLVEDWGGQVPAVEISAKNNKNVDSLLEMVLLVADLEELEENDSRPAKGVIIESNLDRRRGYVATALVQKGILKIGDWIVVGITVGKVKSMEDFKGNPILEAKPSQPVSITGWSKVPTIGKEFNSADSRDEADRLVEENADFSPLFSFFKEPSQEEATTSKKIINLIFKSDVSSSLEAIDNALGAIKSEEVGYKVLGYDIGNISETDVKTAMACGAEIVGFRVKTDESAVKLAEKDGVKIATFDVIYELIEYVRNEMAGLLDAETKKNVLGKLKVLAVFKKDARYQIVGGRITSGKLVRGSILDLIRNDSVAMTGKLGQLQQNKEDVAEAKEGVEVGIRFDIIDSKNIQEIKPGDIIESYQEEKIARSL